MNKNNRTLGERFVKFPDACAATRKIDNHFQPDSF